MKQMLMFLLLVPGLYSFAQQSPVFTTKNGAINGYDPVAYFKSSKPAMGKDEFKMEWQNATWKFASRANLDTFRTDPSRFTPQYGGYCAFGASKNYKAPTSADAWTIVGDKLYLNYDKNVRKEWNKSRDEKIKNADRYWPVLINK